MPDLIFSAVAPAIKKEFYKMCYDSFSLGSETPFEMIFVGPNPPTEFVGEHFRYIYSTVKPAQCIEIGVREAQGQYIIPISDDIIFSDNFLNTFYQEISELDTSHYLLSVAELHPQRFGDPPRGPEEFKTENFFGVNTGQCPCCPRDLWRKLGGIDRRFIHTYFDVDIQFRCYESGMSFRLSKNLYFREVIPRVYGEKETEFNQNRLCSRYKNYSKSLLISLWRNSDGSFSNKRKLPVEPFEDKDIKTISQSEKDQWN